MNKKTAVAGIVAVGIAIGVYVSGLWERFGTGEDGFGIGQQQNGEPSRDAADGEESAKDDDYRAAVATSTTESSTGVPAEPHKVLEVIVSREGYELRGGGGRPEPVELDRLVELAKAAPGNDLGVRVRVFKRESSLPPAEIALKEALEAAGLPERSVYWEEDLLE